MLTPSPAPAARPGLEWKRQGEQCSSTGLTGTLGASVCAGLYFFFHFFLFVFVLIWTLILIKDLQYTKVLSSAIKI